MAYIGSPAAATLAQVADDSVTSAKIADGAVTPSDLSTGHPSWDSSGNVGIGTTSPNLKLTVRDSSNARLLISSEGASQLCFGDTANDYVGRVYYEHTDDSMRFHTNNAERMRILSTGGITFNGDTAAANALDDYEEGTATVSFQSGGGSVTISGTYNTITYTKVGRLVSISGYIEIASVSSPTGRLTLSGLPFTAASGLSFQAESASTVLGVVSTSPNNFFAQIANNTANIVYYLLSGTSISDTAATQVQSSTSFRVTGTYFTT